MCVCACVRCVEPDNLWNYSTPIIARFVGRITGSFRSRVYRQYLSPRAPMQQPLDLTYSTDFTGYLSPYRNYGGLWDIKSERGKDEGQGGDGELRILHTAGSEMAFVLAHLCHDGEGQMLVHRASISE